VESGVGILLKAPGIERPIPPSEALASALRPGSQGEPTMADVQKVSSGIPGLDDLIEGGFWPKSTVVILGSSGTGKSTFAIQFLMEGIEQGEQALYVTLEEPPEQIMREADLMGFDMRKYYEKSLFFIHLKSRNFKKMIEDQLPQLVKARGAPRRRRVPVPVRPRRRHRRPSEPLSHPGGTDPIPGEDLRRGDQDGRGHEGPRPCDRSDQADVETLGLRLLAGGSPPDPLQFVRVEAGRLDALCGPDRQDDGGRHGRPPEAAPRDRTQAGPRGKQPGHRDVPRGG